MDQPYKPSLAGTIVVFLFALPFFCVGMLFAVLPLSHHPSRDPLTVISQAVFGLAFAAIGGGLMYGAAFGYRRMKKDTEIAASQPASPWLWRTDWAEQRAQGHNQRSQTAWWMAAIFCGMLFFPFITMVAGGNRGPGDPGVFVAVGLGVVVLLLLTGAVRATIRRRRFGNSYFEFGALPFVPGQRVSGRIHFNLDTGLPDSIALRLECARTIRTNSGDNEATSRIVLWQGEKTVPSAALSVGPEGRAIPVDFALPPDASETGQQNLSDQVAWTLYVRADVPGVNYTDKFEIPVFRTERTSRLLSGMPAAISTGTNRWQSPTVLTSDQDGETVSRPANAKVVVSMESGQTQFYFPAFRSPRRVLILFALTLFWSWLVYVLYQKRVWPFALTFGFADLLILWGLLRVTFGTARIRVGNGEITSRRGILGMSSQRRLALSDVDSIMAAATLVQGGSSSHVPYLIRLRTKDGRKITLVDEIASRQEARWVAAQIETLAGMKVDTRVEVDLPLSVAGQVRS